MYQITSYVITNGKTSDQIPIKSGYFKSYNQVNEYEAILEWYEQTTHDEPIMVRLIYKQINQTGKK